ncbi:MAG: ABC transporter substrate-binding protein [Anaerocolumna sp.]
MKKRTLSLVMTVVMIITMLTACGKNNSSDTGAASGDSSNTETTATEDTKSSPSPVPISFYTTETGKDDVFQDIISHFQEENPNIKVEYIAAGDDQLQKWMSLYASNEGPAVSLMDPINIYENQERMRAYDPAESTWLDNVVENSLSCYTYDGKVYGIPMSAAGFGLLYNQRVLNEAVGGTFDPSTIKSRKNLEELFQKIEKTGVAASMFTGVNWSLGSHYLGLVYGAYRGDVAARESFTDSGKKGEASLSDDKVFNALMDTFDLIAKYNYNKEDPLVGNVNMDAEAFATGKAGTWFMGDWAWTYIAGIEGRDTEFGILPIPVSDDENDTFNTIIPTSYAKGYCVDASQNTEEQQQAGVKFVEYITMSEYAQQAMSTACGQALPFKNSTATNDSPFCKATSQYITEGKTFDFYGTANMMPSDFWYENGAFMCEYLSGASDRKTLAGNIDKYWKGIE